MTPARATTRSAPHIVTTSPSAEGVPPDSTVRPAGAVA